MAGTCGCGIEPSGSIKCGEFLVQLRTGQLLKTLLHGVSNYTNSTCQSQLVREFTFQINRLCKLIQDSMPTVTTLNTNKNLCQCREMPCRHNNQVFKTRNSKWAKQIIDFVVSQSWNSAAERTLCSSVRAPSIHNSQTLSQQNTQCCSLDIYIIILSIPSGIHSVKI